MLSIQDSQVRGRWLDTPRRSGEDHILLALASDHCDHIPQRFQALRFHSVASGYMPEEAYLPDLRNYRSLGLLGSVRSLETVEGDNLTWGQRSVGRSEESWLVDLRIEGKHMLERPVSS